MDKDRLRTHGPLIIAFIILQILGMIVLAKYAPHPVVVQQNGTNVTVQQYNLPYGFNPPSDVQYTSTLLQLVFSIIFVVFIILLLMKLHVVRVMRVWFFLVSAVAIAVTIFAFMQGTMYGKTIALIIGLAIAFYKVFRPNIIVHNLAELLIYPGIAAVLSPMFSIVTVIVLFVIISFYDMYAVWHSGFMQKMAKYQINQVRVFSGLLVPQFITDAGMVNPLKRSKQLPKKVGGKQKLSVALLGGGDIIFPMLLAGVFMHADLLGMAIASLIGSTLGLTLLIFNSTKGKFYPAMPFITLGAFAGIIVAMLI